jgi:hypothetical protein
VFATAIFFKFIWTKTFLTSKMNQFHGTVQHHLATQCVVNFDGL